MRNVLEEFHAHKGQRKPTILGLREHIFTGRFALLQYLILYLTCFHYNIKNVIYYLCLHHVSYFAVFHHLLGLCQSRKAALRPLANEFWQIL